MMMSVGGGSKNFKCFYGFLCCVCSLISLNSWLFLWCLMFVLVQVLYLSLLVNFLFFNSQFPVLDFRLLPCSEYHVLSSGLFTVVCSLSVNVLEDTVCSETLAFKLQTAVNNPEQSIQQFPVTFLGLHLYLGAYLNKLLFLMCPLINT
jgi:hypothetical protein